MQHLPLPRDDMIEGIREAFQNITSAILLIFWVNVYYKTEDILISFFGISHTKNNVVLLKFLLFFVAIILKKNLNLVMPNSRKNILGKVRALLMLSIINKIYRMLHLEKNLQISLIIFKV